MSATTPKTSTLSKLPGKIYLHPATGEELLITTPSFRQGNASILKSRLMLLINAMAALKSRFW